MRHKENIERKVEEALNSLDGVQKAGPGPFFFTRVQARLQRLPGNGWERVVSFITRPSIALSGLCLIILLNAVAFYFQPAATGNPMAVSAGGNDPSYADDYGNLATNFFYDENPEP